MYRVRSYSSLMKISSSEGWPCFSLRSAMNEEKAALRVRTELSSWGIPLNLEKLQQTKACPSHLRYSRTIMQHFIVPYRPDHVLLAIKIVSYLHIIGKVRWKYFQPGIYGLKEKRGSFFPKSFLSGKEWTKWTLELLSGFSVTPALT